MNKNKTKKSFKFVKPKDEKLYNNQNRTIIKVVTKIFSSESFIREKLAPQINKAMKDGIINFINSVGRENLRLNFDYIIQYIFCIKQHVVHL